MVYNDDDGGDADGGRGRGDAEDNGNIYLICLICVCVCVCNSFSYSTVHLFSNGFVLDCLCHCSTKKKGDDNSNCIVDSHIQSNLKRWWPQTLVSQRQLVAILTCTFGGKLK